MLNLVPFAGAGREMADLNPEPGLIGEPLQFSLPDMRSGAVTATTSLR
jgi:hypothetical protein